jgi:hypothetical protein
MEVERAHGAQVVAHGRAREHPLQVGAAASRPSPATDAAGSCRTPRSIAASFRHMNAG